MEKLRSPERLRDLSQSLRDNDGRAGSKTQMEYAIFFLTNCWVITVLITQIVHHSFLVCFTSLINRLKLARVPFPQDKFF